jgi:4-diphosphocytidyl-2-C-methyl-D-erythritol kinase
MIRQADAAASLPITEIASAKVNLTLTVLGRRHDGYHELDSVVTFAEVGDYLTFNPGADSRITVDGPFAREIVGENLLQRTLVALREAAPELRLGVVQLEKNLPVAAGLGGGSADAAALLRAVRRANPHCAERVGWREMAAQLGADVPVCLAGRPARLGGIGERIEPLAHLPALAAVLINPRLYLPTKAVYAALAAAPLANGSRPVAVSTLSFPTPETVLAYMRAHGNDLEHPATTLLPAIAEVKAALMSTPGCRLAALSGSGPTCFGIFDDDTQAAIAAHRLSMDKRGWWIVATRLAGTAPA